MKFTLKKYNSKNIDKYINNYLIEGNKKNKKYFLSSINRKKKLFKLKIWILSFKNFQKKYS